MKPTPITTVTDEVRRRIRERIATEATVLESGCWVMPTSRDHNGYVRFRLSIEGRKRETGSHRASWLAYRGDIPRDDLQIDHLCRVRHCCNPDHLELVTNRENAIRSVAAIGPAGRGKRPATAPPSKCGRGHDMAGENLRTHSLKNGKTVRVCRDCQRMRAAAWVERNRSAST